MSESTETIPSDFEAREKAVDPTRSFVVSAPAGSGKTGLLTLRVLNLLSIVSKPEEILCITFTRKAAHEMHERIFNALRKAEYYLSHTDEIAYLNSYDRVTVNAAISALNNDRKHNWQLLKTPQRLSISTIDGFCRGLCNQLPIFSGLGTNAGVLDNPPIEYEASVSAWLNYAIKNGDESLRVLIEHLNGDLQRVIQLLTQLLGVRDQWLPLVYQGRHLASSGDLLQLKQQFESILTTWVEHAVNAVQLHFRPYESEIIDLLHYASENLDLQPDWMHTLLRHDHFVLNGTEAAEYWRAMANFCLTKSNSHAFRKKLDKRDGFPTGTSKEEKQKAKEKKQQLLNIFAAVSESLDIDQFGALKKLPDIHYNPDQWRVISALLSILPHLAAYLRLHFIETASTDFVEFSLAAVNALDLERGDVNLMQRLDYRIKHILIDEFQDTSQVQLDLLKALTAEWSPDDDRSLFLVGDGMQSCYSFRNANVGIFLNMRESGLQNITTSAIDLNVNFRSTSTIVDWVNTHFEHAFPSGNDADYGAVKYIPSEAFKPSKPSSFVRCQGFYQREENKNNQALALEEAQYICNEIQQLSTQYPTDSIAILVKSRSHIKSIIQCLIEHGIDYQALEIDSLAVKQHIIDLQTLAKILTMPANKLNWLACLRSAFCGLSHADLYQVFYCDTDEKKHALPSQLIELALTETTLSKTGKQKLKRLHNVYIQHSQFIGRRPLAELLELFWAELGGPEQLSNASAIEDIHRYLSLIDTHESYGQLNWDNFAESVKKLFATPSSLTSNPVQVMTMHKSKGLEFDSVFLPQLHKTPRTEDPELLYWLSRGQLDSAEFVLSPMTAKQATADDSITEFIKAQKQTKIRLEETRVFYVACTRAKSRLFLSAEIGFDEKNLEIKAPSKQSMLGKIWPTLVSEFQSIEVAEHATQETHNAHTPSIKAMPDNWYSPLFTQLNQDSQALTKANELDASKPDFDNSSVNIYELFNGETSAAIIGTAFHKVLQKIVESHALDSLDPTLTHAKTYTPLLRKAGLNSSSVSLWSKRFADCVSALRQNEQAKWLFNANHQGSACELPIIQQTDFGFKKHIIDRTFIDDGIRWVIDYKSSFPSEGESLEEFTARERAHYSNQLERYRNLIVQLDQSKAPAIQVNQIKVALYFPFFQHLEVIEALGLAC